MEEFWRVKGEKIKYNSEAIYGVLKKKELRIVQYQNQLLFHLI